MPNTSLNPREFFKQALSAARMAKGEGLPALLAMLRSLPAGAEVDHVVDDMNEENWKIALKEDRLQIERVRKTRKTLFTIIAVFLGIVGLLFIGKTLSDYYKKIVEEQHQMAIALTQAAISAVVPTESLPLPTPEITPTSEQLDPTPIPIEPVTASQADVLERFGIYSGTDESSVVKHYILESPDGGGPGPDGTFVWTYTGMFEPGLYEVAVLDPIDGSENQTAEFVIQPQEDLEQGETQKPAQETSGDSPTMTSTPSTTSDEPISEGTSCALSFWKLPQKCSASVIFNQINLLNNDWLSVGIIELQQPTQLQVVASGPNIGDIGINVIRLTKLDRQSKFVTQLEAKLGAVENLVDYSLALLPYYASSDGNDVDPYLENPANAGDVKMVKDPLGEVPGSWLGKYLQIDKKMNNYRFYWWNPSVVEQDSNIMIFAWIPKPEVEWSSLSDSGAGNSKSLITTDFSDAPNWYQFKCEESCALGTEPNRMMTIIDIEPDNVFIPDALLIVKTK